MSHKGGKYDSLMIVEKVYKPHQALWDSCYANIFGKKNASKFNTPEGMINFNYSRMPQKHSFIG